jgi:hypothetical protein
MGAGGGIIRAVSGLMLTIPSVITGSDALQVNSTVDGGVVALSGANTCSGGVSLFRGTLYINNAQALGTANAAQGALLVLAFAVGTVPGLVLLGTGASAIFSRYRRQSDILSGAVMILMALKMGYKALTMLL